MDIGITIRSPPHRDRPQTLIAMKWFAATAAFIFSSFSYGAEWTFVPAIQVGETYTDNVNLVSAPLAKSDYVTEIMPSLSLVSHGPYLTVDTFFSAQELDYAEKNAPATLAKQLHADVNAKLIENLLYLDSNASVSQQNISALGAQPTDNIYSTDNRTTVRTYDISPYLRHSFDTFATSELRYSFDSVAADAGGLLNSQSDTVSFDLHSGTAFRLIGWGISYSDRVNRYPDAQSVELENTLGNISYLIDPDFKLTATVGYDNNNYAAIGGSTKGYSWTTGFSWDVSERTSLVATAGRRYYGNTYSLDAATRTRTSIWKLGYNESITTAQSQFGLPATMDTSNYLNQLLAGTITDATQRSQAVNNIIADAGLPSSLANSTNYFTNAVFLQKQLQGSVVVNSPRTTLIVSIFDTIREPLSIQENIDILLGSVKTEQLGGSATLSRKLNSQTSASVALLTSRVTSSAIGGAQSNQTLKFDLMKQFARKLRGTIEIRRDRAESSQEGDGYRENAIEAFFNVQL